MATITTDYKGFKQMAAEFFKEASKENTTLDRLERGFKALGIAYFGLTDPTDINMHEASIILDMASDRISHLEATTL